MTESRDDISGFSMPGFLPFCEDVLGVQLDTRNLLEPRRAKISPPRKNERRMVVSVEQKLTPERRGDPLDEERARPAERVRRRQRRVLPQGLRGWGQSFLDWAPPVTRSRQRRDYAIWSRVIAPPIATPLSSA